jgi:hypothetical protein
MNTKKLLAFLVSIFLILCACIIIFYKFPLITPAIATNEPQTDTMGEEEPPDSYLIEGVPYVGQETDLFCAYASLTMIIRYHGFDTSLEEILYFAGVGYTHIHDGQNPAVSGGFGNCQYQENFDFLASLYGSSAQLHVVGEDEPDRSEASLWDEYWDFIVDNISHNRPIITSVHALELPSLQEQLDVPDSFWTDYSTLTHAIVLVGYDNINDTVCYQDPVAALFGDAQKGTYAWMSRDTLQQAAFNSINNWFVLLAFYPYTEDAPEETPFLLAHEMNIKRLQGLDSAYAPELQEIDGLSLGIHGTQALEEDFSRGLRHRLRSIFLYKLSGMGSRMIHRQQVRFSRQNNIALSELEKLELQENVFGAIALEKEYMVKYLQDIPEASEYNQERSLLHEEANLWKQLEDYLDFFLQRGPFISGLRSLLIMRQMNSIVGDIVDIQQQIIDAAS